MENVTPSTRDWLLEQLGADIAIEKHTYSHQDEVYKIKTSGKNFYLKMASHLQSERDNLLKIASFLHVPTVVGFTTLASKDHLLLSEVPGKNLAELAGKWSDEAIVKEFAAAVKRFHALDASILFPDQDASGATVVHGDMALPNIICDAPGSVSYIDLGQMRLGRVDVELADALWSLQRNLGPDYGELFLEEYGDFVMTEKIDKALQFRYVSPDPIR